MRSNYDENEKEVEEEPNCKIFVESYWKLAVSVLKDIIKSSETVILTQITSFVNMNVSTKSKTI